MTVENQDFEIIAIDHPDYIERMNAIDNITDFKILEESFITDEYITVRMKAYDKLTELYHNTNRYKRMVKLWRDLNGFVGWIHFIIESLGKGNNVERTIRFVLGDRGYPFKDFWNRWYTLEKRNKIFQKVVDVALLPIKLIITDEYHYGYNYIDKDTGIEIRYTDYGIQYHYEMIIKILVEKNNELSHEYIYIRCWNTHPNVHERFYKKINYEVEK